MSLAKEYFMKILLLGEYSALNKNLKEGLIELGHEALVAANGDGFKKIPNDISLEFSSPFRGFVKKIHKHYQLHSTISNFKNFDVVQLINPLFFPRDYFPKKALVRKLIKNNKKIFLSAAGCDAYFWNYGKKNLAYGPFEDTLKYDMKKTHHHLENIESLNFNKWLAGKVRGVIPIMYEYEKSYANCNNKLNVIPIPINIEKVDYKENKIKQKLVIFHGLNRYGFKGTRHVEEAFDYLRKKYPNDLELIIEGHLPINEYLKIMEKANVIVDQMYSHSIGLNGVYALAMGKIVIGGAEPESLKSLGVYSSPVINVKPNPHDLIRKIEGLLEIRKEIPRLGYEGRLFAEKTHSHIKVAGQYIETWKNA